jgi:hypothetical protein
MKLNSRIVAAAFVAVFLTVGFAPSAKATVPACPAGVTNPLTQLVGTWSYNFNGWVSPPIPPFLPFASAGQFIARLETVNGVPNTPVLAITQSTTDGARLEMAPGSFSVNPDCSGGTITFFTSSRGFLFDFWFANNFTELRMISTSPNTWFSGTATRAF